MTTQPELLDTLRQITGATHVLCDGDLSAYTQDWRKRSQGKALAVVRPASVQEVAAIVKACATAGTSLVPQGGNTGLVVGSVPDESGTQVVLSLQRMNAVRAIDAANLTVTVEAGCILQTLQQTAEKAGFLFPLSLAAEGSCTIGGNLASNAGGTQVLRYGNARDLCLGLEVVNAQGEIWHGLSGLRKDNTGYDLRDLFVGSEGTLGIITAATLKLYPQPAARLTAWAALPSMDAAVTLLGLAHQHLGASLTGFEVMGQFALSLVDKHFPQLRVPFFDASAASAGPPQARPAPSGESDPHAVGSVGAPAASAGPPQARPAPSGGSEPHAVGSVGAPYFVLLENSDSESEAHARARFEQLLETAFDQGCVLDAVVAENLSQAKGLWHIRESIPLAQAEEGLNIKHDISIAVSRIPAFVAATDALLRQHIDGVRLVNFGHLGDGNLHYNVQAPEGGDAHAFLRNHEDEVNTLVYDSVARFDGSISAEHGVGSLKTDMLPAYKSPVALSMMHAIKRAMDPQNIMNPGRIVKL
ncbi:FAD-binding oxidoreductase [Polaromonas sp. CG_9.11]|uniref:FAD-binding oxidoreductase n=1 Tax=Polaromonas sp. CG_9.11 TaxID=2787730 RepID=UPI0018CA697D|nr:FAD-binding oxidoreductase [Polaromonas sp. CG_9.11]MBG6076083.1 FAD/FMN-containing dehydrogenase [Polaromonas sp. CG_9.11]